MANLNKVLLIGNLTRDPISRATPGGTAVCELGLAMNRRYRTASGEDREETCFVDIDVFGRQAEQCGRFLRKGSLTFVEGRLRLDQWEDRTTGGKRSRLKVTAERVQFLDSRPRADGDGSAQESAPYAAPYTPQGPSNRPAQPYPGPGSSQQPSSESAGEHGVENGPIAEDEAVDDIPF